MSEFLISQERISQATNIIVQFLRDSGYAGSLEDGTGLNDVVIKPSAVIYSLLAQMVDKAHAYQSLSKAIELKDVIGQVEYDAAVDSIMSNWFVTRNEGKPSYGIVRLWFLQPPDFMHYRDGQRVGAIDSVNVVADGEQVFAEADYSRVLNSTSNVNEYYVDLKVRTAAYSDVAPNENSRVSITYNDIYYLRATIPGTFVAGILVESSEDFIRRTEKAITTRELITDRAINTVLREHFSEIIALYTARHGSGEQLRDVVTFQGVTVHVGNKADIYIGSALTKTAVDVTADENGLIDVDQLPSSSSVVAILGAIDLDGNPLTLTVEVDETTWCNSSAKPKLLTCGTSGQVRLTLLTDPALKSIHDFVFSESQRVACYDPMVKHMFPLLLKPDLHIELINRDIDSTSDIKKAVISYVNSVVKARGPFVCSELVAAVHASVPNVKKILLPLICEGSIFDPLTNSVLTVQIQDKFTVTDNLTMPHSEQISSNTVQFYTDVDMITVSIA